MALGEEEREPLPLRRESYRKEQLALVIGVDPTDAKTISVGTVNGRIWKAARATTPAQYESADGRHVLARSGHGAAHLPRRRRRVAGCWHFSQANIVRPVSGKVAMREPHRRQVSC